MNLISLVLSAGFLLIAKTWASSTSSTTTSSSSSLSSSTSTSSYSSTSLTYSTISSASSVVALPTQIYFINNERPRMINNINVQRSGMKHPLLCQDSLLTSLAQQHANDMAALDTLDHDLPCSSTAFPVQFCSSKTRLSTYGQAAENIVSLTGNNGSASVAMSQFNADAGQFSNMMSPEYLYIGVGMAMNPISGKYYWVQVLSNGNFQGVSCTYEPSVTVLDAYNRTTTTVQPAARIIMSVYPQGITNNKVVDKNGLYCTMIPFARGSGSSVLPLGQLPYPTITMVPFNSTAKMNSQITGIIGAFAAALSRANATIVGPSSINFFPMQVQTSSSTSSSTSISSSSTTSSITSTSASPVSLEAMLSSFTPSNASQSSLQSAMSSMLSNPEMSSLLANPTMSSAAIQMAQYMMMATSSKSSSTMNPTST